MMIRWIQGQLCVGLLDCKPLAAEKKSLLIEFMLRRDYPYTKVCTVANWRIGAAQSANIGFDEGEVLDKMLAGANLVFDATANPAVNSALSALAAERGLPYIFISGTPGMWGGRIVRIMPGGSKGCFHCYSHAVMVGDIPMPISAGDEGLIEPPGCSAPTFTGTYFDASEIAMGGVRIAVSTLMEGVENGYPSTSWDVDG